MNPELLVYTPKITPRIRYIFKHVFTRVLEIPISFTSEVNEFVAFQGPKCSYTTKQLGNEIHFGQVDLLLEQGINDVSIQISDWDNVPTFFSVKDEEAALPFDIFAASFFMLTRYEEYLPHVKDAMGRFPASESLAQEYNFLEIPIVDIWVERLKEVLKEKFEGFQLDLSQPSTMLNVQVKQAYAYRKVGFLRSVGGYVRDLVKLRLGNVFKRTQVILGFRKDPLDIFSWLINVQRQCQNQFVVFFELGDASERATNIRHSKTTFQSLIKMVGDYCRVGLLNSFEGIQNPVKFRQEKLRLESIIHRPLQATTFRDHLINIPISFRQMIELEIDQDYSLGFPDKAGFRAGTSKSFLFYDLDYEIQSPLVIHPAIMPLKTVVNDFSNTIDALKIDRLYNTVKNVGGTFSIYCSNEDLSNAITRNYLKKLLLSYG